MTVVTLESSHDRLARNGSENVLGTGSNGGGTGEDAVAGKNGNDFLAHKFCRIEPDRRSSRAADGNQIRFGQRGRRESCEECLRQRSKRIHKMQGADLKSG